MRWWSWFVPVLLVCCAWALASPALSAPDERAHVVRVAAVARGQWHGHDTQGIFGFVTQVRVPATFSNMGPLPRCYAKHPDVTPDCTPKLVEDSKIVPVNTVAGRYPLLFYALLAPIARLAPSLGGVELMRLAGAALCAAFLASAFESASRLGRNAVLGVAVATTPIVLYFTGTVNPSGLELATAIAIWATAAALARAPTVDRRLLVRIAIAFAVCANTRSLSLPLAGIAVAAPLLLASRDRWRELFNRVDAQIAAGVMVVASLAAIAWVLILPTEPHVAAPPFTVSDGIDRIPTNFVQSVAHFGIFEVRVDTAIYVWLIAVVVLVGCALAIGRLRENVVVLGVLGLTLTIPIVVNLAEIPPLYHQWQGRYGLPVDVGVVILAGMICTTAPRFGGALRTLAPPIAVVLGAMQLLCFLAVARRYAVGAHGRILYFLDPAWGPTSRTVAVLVMGTAGLVALTVLIVRSDTRAVRAAEPLPVPAPVS